MRRLLLLALSLSLVGVALTALPTFAAGGDALPPELEVPDGHRLTLNTLGRGVQVYECKDRTWTFVEPNAVILRRGRVVATHYAGPTWQSTKDGSKVTAAAVANVPAADPEQDIPQLLLKSTGNQGAGAFGEVAFIQRLETRGGVAPDGGVCDPAEDVERIGVPYTANYKFWVPAS